MLANSGVANIRSAGPVAGKRYQLLAADRLCRDDIGLPMSARTCRGQTTNSLSKKLKIKVSSFPFSLFLFSQLNMLWPRGIARGQRWEPWSGPQCFHGHCGVTAAHYASSTWYEEQRTRSHGSVGQRECGNSSPLVFCSVSVLCLRRRTLTGKNSLGDTWRHVGLR